MQLVTRLVRDQLLALFPVDEHAAVCAGLERLRLEFASLALEALRAEQAGLWYPDAARRPEYPMLGRGHFGLLDMLQWEVPAPEREYVEALFRRAAEHTPRFFEHMLFRVASASDETAEPALARFFLFELVRAAVWIGTWGPGGDGLEGLGVLDELDRRAEAILRDRYRQYAMQSPDVRPMHVVMHELWDELAALLPQHTGDLRGPSDAVAHVRELIDAARYARALSAADAVLIRHAMVA